MTILTCPFCDKDPWYSETFREIACKNPDCGISYHKGPSWDDTVLKWDTRKGASDSAHASNYDSIVGILQATLVTLSKESYSGQAVTELHNLIEAVNIAAEATRKRIKP